MNFIMNIVKIILLDDLCLIFHMMIQFLNKKLDFFINKLCSSID